jgi:hypothetical protein
MQSDDQANSSRVQQPSGASFRWAALAVWLSAAAMDGAAVAWLASLAEQHWAPLVVFPLLVGCVLGMTLAGLMRLVQVGHRPTLLAGTLVAVTVAVAGQHYAAYREAVGVDEKDAATFRLAQQAFGDQVAGRLPAPPMGVLDFLSREAARGRPMWGDRVARGAAAWLTWALDGLLLAASALGAVVAAWRQPYCDRCRSWFRTTRRGPLDAESIRDVAAAAGITVPDGLLRGRYRLVTCLGGCTTAGFELCWQEAEGKWASTICLLDAQRRNEVVGSLDAAARAERV